MNLAGLDFDKIPPFSVPIRFFFVATLFAFVSAFIIMMAGESLWLSRWHPATLALTHAIVIGVISMIMCGAILQLLPVLAGKSLPYVQAVSMLTLSGLGLGTLLLVSAFWFSYPPLFQSALLLLTGVFVSFFCALLWVIKQRSKNSFSVNTLRLGFAAILIVVVIAGLMLADYLFGSQFNVTKQLTDNHASWGLVGWVSLVIMGVSFQVLPMFHVAPAFPVWSTKYLPAVLFSVLIFNLTLSLVMSLFITSGVLTDGIGQNLFLIQNICTALLKLCLSVYALIALNSLRQRKRKISDTSVTCWKIALSSLLICSLFSLLPAHEILLDKLGWSPLSLAAVFIYGWVISVIMAMIIKIVPFLAYLHLQRQCGYNLQAFALLPNVHQLLSKKQMQYLLYCHTVSLISLILTLIQPSLHLLLATMLMVQFGYLFFLLRHVSKRYHKITVEINTLTI
ncbi:MAG: hypothetical protein ACI86X_002278 [Moritella sp.]|jgi:hypothetical protein